MKRIVLAVVSVLALILTGVRADAKPEAARWPVCGEWRFVPVRVAGELSGELEDVAVVSPDDAWAAGYVGAGFITDPLVLRWTGPRWERVAFPKLRGFDGARISAVAVVTPAEVWAVGTKANEARPSRPFSARWDGSRWRLVPIGIRGLRGSLHGLAVTPGSHRLWAVGSTDAQTLVLRWNGGSWRRVPSPSPGVSSDFKDVVTVSRTAWAVGSMRRAGERTRILASRWTGDDWTVRTGPRGRLEAVDGLGPGELWAVGASPSDRPGYSNAMIVRWDGLRWSLARRLDRISQLDDVVVTSPTDAWAVGSLGRAPYHPLVMRRHLAPWRVGRAPDVRGWFSAIDGTPHNLWAPHAALIHGGEPTRFDAYHRC